MPRVTADLLLASARAVTAAARALLRRPRPPARSAGGPWLRVDAGSINQLRAAPQAKLPKDRPLLHAQTLGFEHPITKEALHFQARARARVARPLVFGKTQAMRCGKGHGRGLTSEPASSPPRAGASSRGL